MLAMLPSQHQKVVGCYGPKWPIVASTICEFRGWP